ncbi:hypothetical protein OHB26_09540 [Nocardia sp. NBC_01503]|uniref:hypothetical protein n=1 Tax=Nocardia sp. NBC_01503 TaxID=2975997 RepID=UPI002E7C07E3|nr:hypothetical protein [Nocardia sp. NBC_01503]WTL34418.1 hypothetical protein OHB26_09540 [Nocardia sp. NBC_01503]
MRTEFQDRAALGWQGWKPDVTETELDQIHTKTEEYDRRWLAGPHAEHWQYLSDAYQDCRERPDTMRRFLENIEHNRRVHGYDLGVTEVQRQSLIQAQNLANEERSAVRQMNPPKHGIERGR